MANGGAIVFAAIAPHPPIMVPEVGHESIAAVRGSITAMEELTDRLLRSGAETLVMISPHAPLAPDAFVAYSDLELHGDFADFRAREATVEANNDEELLTEIEREAINDSYNVIELRRLALDHGIAVPLYFLQRNGWCGNVVALGYSFLSNDDHRRFGGCIRRAAEKIGRPIAFVASGDLSHRLRPEAPAGFNPAAHRFDDEVVAALRENAPERIAKIDFELRKLAGECGYRSMLVALGAIDDRSTACEVLNYEAPFGVGYLVAQLVYQPEKSNQVTSAQRVNETAASHVDDEVPQVEVEAAGQELPALARRAIETYVRTGRIIDPPPGTGGLLCSHAACFVSIKTTDGHLRGCIGTIEPTRPSLAQELIANAVSAANSDPRFPPVAEHELTDLHYSVDVLSVPEPASFADLDPRVFGVIVEDESGKRRGLLLPDIPGVEIAEAQVAIAARKAGIASGTPIRLMKFKVGRYKEASTANDRD